MKIDTPQEAVACKPLTVQVMKRRHRVVTTPLACVKGFSVPTGFVERRKTPRSGDAWVSRD